MRAESRFAAMGTHAHVLVLARDAAIAARLVEQATERIEQLEARWSRFRPTSELNRLNACAGTPAIVSADTIRLVEAMRIGHSVTAGAYDPTVLDDITALGYDRDFHEKQCVVSGAYLIPKRRTENRSERRHRGCNEIMVSAKSRLVWLPDGVGIDPGGIGKGLAADIVAEELTAAGALGALVNIGGDLRVVGRPDDADCWSIEVEDPLTGEPAARVALVDGGLATSSTERRTWQHDAHRVHHIIDPATGMSTPSQAPRSIVGATVIAREAWRAEVLTKACIVRAADGLELVDRSGAAARVTRADGRAIANAAWRRHALVPEEAGAR